jgi:hypothetical protein
VSELRIHMKHYRKIIFIIPLVLMAFIFITQSSCGVYRFTDASVPDSIKTVRVQFIENRASYINPQLSPALTDRLRQKINNQTRLTQTNAENAHYDISGSIVEYSISTSAIANREEVTNRLTVRLKITLNNQLANSTQDYDVTRNFEFPANSSIQAAESRLMDEMLRSLTDDIFNRIFSKW